ncbi:MAG: hypothetical protein KA314_23680 [Chloroflexi bacterium]|nr:hypothetical protein [Chloroflexota bacterium]MBP8058846.1 hypothetical protein [Chloroflexota bacterium]
MISKRQLGFIFIGLGGLGILGSFIIDWLRVNDYGGIGPTQKLGLLAAGLLIGLGLTLLPLGQRPA